MTCEETTWKRIYPIVLKAVNTLYRWLGHNVVGIEQCASLEDRRSLAFETAYRLETGNCRCEQYNCFQEHSVAAWDAAQITLEAFLFRAVIGPYGLRTKSIAEGMLFAILKQDGNPLHIGKVAFKECANAQCAFLHNNRSPALYEGGTCLHCGTAFAPDTTRIVGVDRVLVEGIYLDKRFWRCGAGTLTHYYAQNLCREEEKLEWDEEKAEERVSYHVPSTHGKNGHDGCPWSGCSEAATPKRHPQRGTLLRVRAGFEGALAQAPDPPLRFLNALAAGMKRALDELEPAVKLAVLAWAETVEADSRIGLADALLTERNTPLTSRQKATMRVTFQSVLEQHGIDEEVIDIFLYRAAPTPDESEVTQDEQHHDN